MILEDLYYRLNVFPIEMPALRDRYEDIPILLNELISRMENEKRGSIRFNSAAIMSILVMIGQVTKWQTLNDWPFYILWCDWVQELPKKYRHIDDLDEQEIRDQLPVEKNNNEELNSINQPALLPVNGLDLKEYLTDLECNLIKQALEDANGVVARAAEKLHIRRTTLVEKMRKYNLNRKEMAGI